jgi:hypothetical protein
VIPQFTATADGIHSSTARERRSYIMKTIIARTRLICGTSILALLAMSTAARADAAALIEISSSPYGAFGGLDYVRHAGRFVGETSRGAFRVPFEIVAPADPRRGNRTVLFEAPHFIYGTAGRDSTFGPDLLFQRRFSHASVGFSNEGFNLLDPFVADAIIAGESVIANNPPFLRDVEILKQFVEALRNDPAARNALGNVKRRYAYGVSQSAEALYELFYGPGGTGIFDLTILHVPLWRPPFARADVLAALPDDFTPLPDIGKVMIVSAEGDLLISESLELRHAVSDRNYRVYEVAGAPHLADDSPVAPGLRTNPLDVAPVVRAAFVRGDRWVRRGMHPPRNRLLHSAPDGDIDPIYLAETGIARDANGNAAGGVRFPDVAIGRAFFVASALDIEVIPGLPGLIGFWTDLACAPAPGSDSIEARISSHREYVLDVWRQTLRLLAHGYLLPADASALVRSAADSDVGKAGYCG